MFKDIKKIENELVIDSLIRHLYKREVRLRTLFLGIKLGIDGSSNKFIDVLMRNGDKTMAEDFLNSGSQVLSEAGNKWATLHGYTIKQGEGSHRVNWGAF
jgi:hypothetical protein